MDIDINAALANLRIYEAKLKRKIELEEKISDLQAQIRELKELVRDFEECKKAISEAIEEWGNSKNAYNQIQLSPVKVTSYFEGDCAEKANVNIIPTIAEINAASSAAGRVSSGIPAQVELLEEEIERLEKEVEALNKEIEELGI